MRRRRLLLLTLVAALPLGAACDTDDGRTMQTPDSLAVFRLEQTTTTTSTTTPLPTEVVPPTTAATTSSSSTSTSAAPSSTQGAASTTAAGRLATSTTAGGSGPAAGLLQFEGPWADGAAIPPRFTCDGAGDAPLVTWTAPPEVTAEIAVSVVDLDADGFVHWLVVGLPPQAGSIGGGEPIVAGATEALNSSGNPGWFPPCPPNGDGPHRYRFTLHLLDQVVELPADSPPDDLLGAVEASTAERATFTGQYERA